MKLTNDNSDSAVLKEMGNRIAQYRLNQDKTQAALAQEAGVSNRTMTRVENGNSIQASSLIRILRALKLVDNLDGLIPEPVASPRSTIKIAGEATQKSVFKIREALQRRHMVLGG